MSNAMPLNWHKECLKNNERLLQEQHKEFDRLATALDRMERDIDFYRIHYLRRE